MSNIFYTREVKLKAVERRLASVPVKEIEDIESLDKKRKWKKSTLHFLIMMS